MGRYQRARINHVPFSSEGIVPELDPGVVVPSNSTPPPAAPPASDDSDDGDDSDE